MDLGQWRFLHKEFFLLYILLAVLVLIAIMVIVRREKILSRLGDIHLARMLVPEVSNTKRWIKLIIWTVALSSFIFGMADLQWGSKEQEVQVEGGNIMICLDVSKSMLAEDIRPNRLVRAVQSIQRFIDKLQGDQVGIILFAGEAYVQLPLTPDYTAAKLVLNSVSPESVPLQGTNITGAIMKATESLASDEGKSNAIIIITDGESHEPNALQIAEETGEKDVMINTIGIGSENGVPIPEYKNGIPSGYKKDNEGNTVITKLNSQLLKDIAEKANGVYVQATNADIGLDAVHSKIKQLSKKKRESKMYTDYEDQFLPFFYIALILLLVEFIINERVSQLWKKINLFKDEKA